MIVKDLMPWMFVKKTATWTPYAKIRSEAARLAPVFSARPARKLRRPPRG